VRTKPMSSKNRGTQNLGAPTSRVVTAKPDACSPWRPGNQSFEMGVEPVNHTIAEVSLIRPAPKKG
jgi:hypothetical protein